MFNPIIDQPAPDFAGFVAILRGEQRPDRVRLVELSMDGEIMQALTERYLNTTWFDWPHGFEFTPPAPYFEQVVRLYYRLGYDYAPVWGTWPGHPTPAYRTGDNTAPLAAGQRNWVEESWGMIRTWEDFERFPWDELQPDPRPVEYAARYLREGMKLTVNTTYFEHIFQRLLGIEGLSYLLYDVPELVEAVFTRWGQKVYDYYAAVIDHEAVGAIFHADDMGFKTSTLISPKALRWLVLPWLKQFAELAHQHNKIFCLHSDGNLYNRGIMDDLIDDVKIDGKHAFEDIIMSVGDFQATYGRRVATLGGVDMDQLVRTPEPDLRQYIRDILDTCMPHGRFAFGTGNTVSNYVPIENYVIMLEEARRWTSN